MVGFWCLDPIDGTKGFLRGEQYAVCLALVRDGEVQLGVLGCPNLPVDAAQPAGPRGALFVGVRGQGAYQVRPPLLPPTPTLPLPLMRLCPCAASPMYLYTPALIPTYQYTRALVITRMVISTSKAASRSLLRSRWA